MARVCAPATFEVRAALCCTRNKNTHCTRDLGNRIRVSTRSADARWAQRCVSLTLHFGLHLLAVVTNPILRHEIASSTATRRCQRGTASDDRPVCLVARVFRLAVQS